MGIIPAVTIVAVAPPILVRGPRDRTTARRRPVA
jgi:hypothetical protein